MKILSIIIAAACVTGCATVSKQEVAQANFGPIPTNYQQQVRAVMAMELKDPYSAVYRFDQPRKGFDQDGFLTGGKRHYGWIVPFYVNAKNGFGGYVGEEKRFVFLGADGANGDCTAVMGQMANFVD